MRTKTILLASSAVVALSIAATPAEAAGNFYVTVYGGVNFLNDESFAVATVPSSSTTFTFNGDADVGFAVGAAVGLSLHDILPGLRGEVEVAYRQQDVDGPWASFTTGVGSYSGVVDYDQSSFAVMANLWYDLDLAGVRPYFGGGVGWARTEIDGNFGPTPTFDIDNSGFAWQLGAGINFDISPNVMLGVGYRYFNGPEVTIAAPGAPANPLTGELESENHSGIVNVTVSM
jgi:opacity protein-like surface antigen